MSKNKNKNKNNWAPEDCCLACKGHGCGDCGNTGLESEALSHGCHKVVRDSHNLPHIVDTLTGYALGPAGRFV